MVLRHFSTFLVLFLAGFVSSCAHPLKPPRPPTRIPSSTCLDWTPQKRLNFVGSKQTSLQISPVVSFALQGKNLKVSFLVDTSNVGIYGKSHLGTKEFPYQYDVVEVFVAVKDEAPSYLEIQLSPYNQAFQVSVENKNGKKHMKNGVDMGVQTNTVVLPTSWNAEILIPLENLKWDGRPENITGNVFAVLGKGELRTYWGLNYPPTQSPNFHNTDLFRPLLSCPSSFSTAY